MWPQNLTCQKLLAKIKINYNLHQIYTNAISDLQYSYKFNKTIIGQEAKINESFLAQPRDFNFDWKTYLQLL